MDFEAVAGDDDFLDRQPEDRLFGGEVGVFEPIAQPGHHDLRTRDLLDGEISLDHL